MVKRDPKTNKNKIHICPRCKGNGYIKIPNKSVEEPEKEVTVQCTMCESEGELELNDPNDTIIIDADGIHRLQ
jgi:transcription elongation factor Elf1